MIFFVNNSLFVGCEGKWVIFCKLCECLLKELEIDVFFCVEEIESLDVFIVFGCGEFYFGILIENMCCEGYEF